MAFFEDRFPVRIAEGSKGGPRFKTTITRTDGGRRQANRDWSAPLHFFDVRYGVKSAEDFEDLRQFFWVVYGAYDGFRFKHYDDYQVSAARGVCTLVSGSIYQLYKNYTYGARTVARIIEKPVSGTVQVYRTRASVTSAIATTNDHTTGRVTVSGHQGGDTYTWAGEFDIPMAFADDALEALQIGHARKLHLELDSIQVEEIRISL